MGAPPQIEIHAFTDRGRLRRDNEDTITVAGWISEPAMPGPRRSQHALTEPLLVAIADGMGGHAAGEVASRYAIERMARWAAGWTAGKNPAIPAGSKNRPASTPARSSAQAETMLADALAAVNAGMYQAMTADPGLLGMGTTIVGLLLTAERALCFNVGDSRLYRERAGGLQQLSIDDVPPGERLGIITQTLGGGGSFLPIVPHVAAADLAVPSRWLLCSDGLTDMLGAEAIERTMRAADHEAVSALFTQAMAAGGADNISIILASVRAAA